MYLNYLELSWTIALYFWHFLTLTLQLDAILWFEIGQRSLHTRKMPVPSSSKSLSLLYLLSMTHRHQGCYFRFGLGWPWSTNYLTGDNWNFGEHLLSISFLLDRVCRLFVARCKVWSSLAGGLAARWLEELKDIGSTAMKYTQYDPWRIHDSFSMPFWFCWLHW